MNLSTTSHSTTSVLLVSIAAASSGLFAPAYAREPLVSVSVQAPVMEEIVVTAQKRPEFLSDVPLSLLTMSGDRMVETGIYELADLTIYIPNFQKSDTPFGSYLAIRGIGSGINQGFEQSVMQYADEIALGRSSLARLPIMDLKRIEVLRGPQNVLFGKNSIAGAVSLVTNKPTDNFQGAALVEYEPDYNTRLAQFMVSGPLTDTLRGRLALRYYSDDGYFDNNLNGDEEAAREDLSWRGLLAWDLSERADVLLKVEQTTMEQSGRGEEMIFTYANPIEDSPLFGRTYPELAEWIGPLTDQEVGSDDGQQNFRRNTNIDDDTNLDTNIVSLTVNWEAENFSFTSITGYLAFDTDDVLDLDGSGIENFVVPQQEDYEQFSQEFRLTSPGGETIDWIAGVYYEDWDLDFSADFTVDDENMLSALGILGEAIGNPGMVLLGSLANLTAERRYSGDSENWAVFAQATWNITHTARLTLGGRYTDERKSVNLGVEFIRTSPGEVDPLQVATASAVLGMNSTNPGDSGRNAASNDVRREKRSDDAFTPTAILEWDITNNTMFYASASRGFKAGGFDARAIPVQNLEYGDEDVFAYELGTRSRLLNNRLELNTALFYSDYKDLQVSQFDGVLGFVVGNAEQATSQGVEVDGRWLLRKGLTLTFAAAYLDFEFDKYEGGACSGIHTVLTGETRCDYSGKRHIFTPEWTAGASLDYIQGLTPKMRFHATVDLNYRDDQFVDTALNPDIKQEAYTKVNARLALEAQQWALALVGKNLSDEEITAFAYDSPLSAVYTVPANTGYLERPRTFTLQALYRF